MELCQDDTNDPKYSIFNKQGKLIGLRDASEEIKQVGIKDQLVGGICYVLSKINSLAPLIENNFEIKELPEENGIRIFEVKNKIKNDSKIVPLRIGKIPGYPKSKKGIDIQVLLEYLKEEIKDVNIELINKLKNLKNGSYAPELFTEDEQKKIERILIEIGDNFSYYDKVKKQMNLSYIESVYGEFIEKDKNNESKIKNNDIKAFMDKILSDQENFDYIIDNIPGFIMSSGGNGVYLSSILTGRPSKLLKFEDYKDKEELKKIFEKLYNNSINELNFLTISIKGHELAVKDLVKINDQLCLAIKNPWGSGNKEDIVSKETDKLLKDTKFSEINKNY